MKWSLRCSHIFLYHSLKCIFSICHLIHIQSSQLRYFNKQNIHCYFGSFWETREWRWQNPNIHSKLMVQFNIKFWKFVRLRREWVQSSSWEKLLQSDHHSPHLVKYSVNPIGQNYWQESVKMIWRDVYKHHQISPSAPRIVLNRQDNIKQWKVFRGSSGWQLTGKIIWKRSATGDVTTLKH